VISHHHSAATIDDLSIAIKLDPSLKGDNELSEALKQRAEARAEKELWVSVATDCDSALAHWNKSTSSSPRDIEVAVLCSERVVARLGSQQEAAAKLAAANAWSRYARSDDSFATEMVVATCAVLPDSITDWSAVVRRLKLLPRRPADLSNCPYALGAALVRAGSLDEAIKSLQPPAPGSGAAYVSSPHSTLFLALAYARAGKQTEANRCLREALAI
jgi:uncharacterized protein HemY